VCVYIITRSTLKVPVSYSETVTRVYVIKYSRATTRISLESNSKFRNNKFPGDGEREGDRNIGLRLRNDTGGHLRGL
jgi:hypothetical protein